MLKTEANNDYSFNEFIDWRTGFDFYNDDPFLKKMIAYYVGDVSEAMQFDLTAMSKKLSGSWGNWVEVSALPENLPRMIHFDGHNNRIDRIVRPKEMELLEKEVYEEAIFSKRTDPWVAFIKKYLLNQLGEAGINCGLCNTGGLIEILEKFADAPETHEMLRHLKEGIDGDYAVGGQYLSELQGGSDVKANQVVADKTGDGWRIYGTKFFCSAAHADYSVITARPTNAEQVGTFVVPSWLPGDKQRERRNNFVINKLKSKLGTRELPTAEITYHGALAYQLGPIDRGLSNMVGIVLAHSRFYFGTVAAANIARAAREAKRYSAFREAFGRPIKDFGMVAMQINQLEQSAMRSTAGVFKIQSQILALSALERGEVNTKSNIAYKKRKLHVRLLVMLNKMVTCNDSAKATETAMSIFGGHGLMEDFSCLPRLFRDAVVYSGGWEGPRNLLLSRLFEDMKNARDWCDPATLVADLLESADRTMAEVLAMEAVMLLDYPTLAKPDLETQMICERWEVFCSDLMHAYQDQAVRDVVKDSRRGNLNQ